MKIIVFGIMGRMGQAVVESAKQENEIELIGFDNMESVMNGIPVFSDFVKLPDAPDFAIDFSSPELITEIADWSLKSKTPLISGTTGLSHEQIDYLKLAARSIPVFYASNFSLTIALLGKFTEIAARFLDDADIEIVEYHHRNKADAPSGTALNLAQKIATAKSIDENSFVFGRKGHTGVRSKNEIGIHAIRGGGIVGEHRIIFALPEDEMILTHRAISRNLFAKGALKAARWLLEQKTGFYTPEDYINSIMINE